MTIIIDRRLNPKDKNLTNRQKFIHRAKAAIRNSIKGGIQKRNINDVTGDQNVNVPTKDILEDFFHKSSNQGKRNYIAPGNKDYMPGDKIIKPKKGEGKGKKGSNSDESGEDDFQFTLSKDEFMDIFFEDLDLPDMVKENLKEAKTFQNKHAGFTTSGSPSNLSIEQTMKKALSRKIALNRPKSQLLKDLELRLKELEELDPEDEEVLFLKEKIKKYYSKMKVVPFIDPIDLRYRATVKEPLPKSQAVMFCLMDVSGSMGEREKDLSKRFFMLLYMFLIRKYETIDIIFVRHHTQAFECSEDEFFNNKDNGGTVVSSGLLLIDEIITDRYNINDWNIYISQCSDGDNYTDDSPYCEDILEMKIMKKVQYFCYIEIQKEGKNNYYGYGIKNSDDDHSLWNTYDKVCRRWKTLQLRAVTTVADIFPVFHGLFEKKARS